MGGGNRRFTKNRSSSRRGGGSSRGLFVEGGLLSDWQLLQQQQNDHSSSSSPQSNSLRGKNPNKGKGKSVMNPGKFDGSSCKPSGSTIGYIYPVVDAQEVLRSESCHDDFDLNELSPVVLVDSSEDKMVPYVDQTPSLAPIVVEDYGQDMVLGEKCYTGLGFSNEMEMTTLVFSLPSNDKEMYTPERCSPRKFDLKGSGEKIVKGSCGEKNSGMVLGENFHTGLGFSNEMEAPRLEFGLPSADEEICVLERCGPEKCDLKGSGEKLLVKGSSRGKNSGFLSIGGMKLYTVDVSDEESDGYLDGDRDSLDEGSSGYSESSGSEELSDDDSEDMSFDADSDIDEEVAEDYIEGIGGASELGNAKSVGEHSLNVSDGDSSSSSSSKSLKKLDGLALENASKEYGMQKHCLRKKGFTGSRGDKATLGALSLALDDIVFVKDPRSAPGRKKNAPQFPRSWPGEIQKSKNFRTVPGEKKKYRKEHIAIKRRERMIRRGVDLEEINLKLKQMVLDKVDILSFQPMNSRDCSQVQRLASIYHLHSGRQGSGKKRFVTVTRSAQTGMPSSYDKLRLEKLLGEGAEDDIPMVKHESEMKRQGGRCRVKKVSKLSDLSQTKVHQSAPSKLPKNFAYRRGSNGASVEKRVGDKGLMYAGQPVSFVSSGVMKSDSREDITTIDEKPNKCYSGSKVVTSSSKLGAFEVHTKGFGSKMMAKMGFVEGGGLGRDGQGVVEPVEAVKRPKSLGLGVNISEVPDSGNARDSGSVQPVNKIDARDSGSVQPAKKIGSFERHTKGFGSKMMTQMGFVEGMGLGRDAQGMVNPLVAIRLPKSRGLGARN